MMADIGLYKIEKPGDTYGVTQQDWTTRNVTQMSLVKALRNLRTSWLLGRCKAFSVIIRFRLWYARKLNVQSNLHCVVCRISFIRLNAWGSCMTEGPGIKMAHCYKVRLVVFNCYKVRLVVFKLLQSQTCHIQHCYKLRLVVFKL